LEQVVHTHTPLLPSTKWYIVALVIFYGWEGSRRSGAATAADEKTTVALTEVTEAEPEPEVEGHVLVLDMTSSAIESRRRRQRRGPRDDVSSDADRETALITHVNVDDDVGQMSSDSCHSN